MHTKRKNKLEMKSSKFFLNKRWITFIVAFSILLLLGIWTVDEDFPLSIGIIAISCFLILGYIFIFPNSYRIDDKGIIVYYGFGIKTYAKWDEIRTIEERYWGIHFFITMYEYHIGYFPNTFLFWKMACIPKNKKTTFWIEKYYKKPIR